MQAKPAGAKPVLLVTRRLPEAVTARASRDYDVRLDAEAEDAPSTPDRLIAAAEGAAALLAPWGARARPKRAVPSLQWRAGRCTRQPYQPSPR